MYWEARERSGEMKMSRGDAWRRGGLYASPSTVPRVAASRLIREPEAWKREEEQFGKS